jgi:hypothetical protein
MKPLDKLLFGLLFGASFPLFFFLVAITLYYFFQDIPVYIFIIPGLIAGAIIDILFFKRFVNNTFELPTWTLVIFYLFYNICIYGMFMGFPVINLVMGIVAGYYCGIKINRGYYPEDQIEKTKKRVALFTGSIMVLICIASALIALTEKSIGQELQGMLGLKFQVTKNMVIALILIGGLTLIFSEYYLTKIAIKLTLKYIFAHKMKASSKIEL